MDRSFRAASAPPTEERFQAAAADQMALALHLPSQMQPAAAVREQVQPDPDGIEPIEPNPGRRIARFASPPATLGERLTRLAYRFGMSGATLAAPFRKPEKPRIGATVESPVPGDRVAGMALRAGHFLAAGVKAPIDQIDFTSNASLAPPVEAAVHGFTWLRDLAASAPAPQCAPTAERVLAAWLDANAQSSRGKGAAWDVENVARRLLAWLVHAPLILSATERDLRARTIAEVVETARWLDRNAGKAKDRHGEALAWCAIIAAGLLLPEGKPRRLFGEAGLVRALGEMVGEDGGVLSRSPLAQMDAIAMLTDLLACYRAVRREPPEAIEAMLQALVPPLLALTGSNGSLGNWHRTGVRARPLREGGPWGYQRVAARRSVLVCDAAPPPLARHARAGCASTLAFEFSHGVHALIVNCGGAALAGGQVPARIEQGLRATAAHSTLVLGDANSTAVLINGKLGSGVAEVEVDRRAVTLGAGGGATRLELCHNGYAARLGLLHRRVLTLHDDGAELRGEDLLVPSGRKKRGKVSYAIRFHLGPHVEVRLAADGGAADLLLPDGEVWRFVADDMELAAEESLWVDGDGCPVPVEQLVMEGLVSRGGAFFTWRLSKMG